MTEDEKFIEQRLPEWAKESRELVKKACEYTFMLSLELDRLRNNEALHEETDQAFEDWTDEFFEVNGLAHLIEPYHNFISSKLDEEND